MNSGYPLRPVASARTPVAERKWQQSVIDVILIEPSPKVTVRKAENCITSARPG
jgi:hypothetical protein